MQQFTCLLLTPFWAIRAHHHGNQSALTVHRRSNQVKTSPRSVSGFQAINVHGFIPQQSVTVLLGNTVPGEAFLTVHVIKRRLTMNDCPGQHRQIVS
ncbi:hypothetical protein SDC9_189156 [bioreactor metagenome]|uniref:Uncharacterized protein n=1 Tax=bioreactor metagenome TaxID=1076179 RepID=A0A645HT05_9ZZZZ